MNNLAEVKTLDTKPERNRSAMAKFLLETIKRVQAGEVTAIMCVAEAKTGYEYTRER